MGLVYDHWAASSALLRQRLLIPLNNETTANTTVVRIEEGHKTVITMGGVGSETNVSFRFLQECMEWVLSHLVSGPERELLACVPLFFNSVLTACFSSIVRVIVCDLMI